MKRTLIFVFVVAFTVFFTTGAYAAGWVLYDNFDKYANIDEMKASGKWYIDPADETIANFSIVNGRLRIEHLAGNPNDSAWAQLIKKSSTIMGIRATIEVESWAGDVRARIAATVGFLKNNPDHIVWYDMGLRHYWADWVVPATWMEFVRGYAGVLDGAANYAWLYDLFYTELGAWKHPTMVGTPYKITTKFDRRNAFFQVNVPADLGKVNFTYVEAIGKLEETLRAIGTRSDDDAGTCVVYFDDVYVYRP
jgi:hypothetical protein